jgi:ribonuclease HI
MIEIHADGSCRGNPGPMSAVVIIDDFGTEIKRMIRDLGEGTNNIAEYGAVKIAMEWLRDNNISGAVIFTDSKLVAEQLNGNYKVTAVHLMETFKYCKELMHRYNITVKWVARNWNKAGILADRIGRSKLWQVCSSPYEAKHEGSNG